MYGMMPLHTRVQPIMYARKSSSEQVANSWPASIRAHPRETETARPLCCSGRLVRLPEVCWWQEVYIRFDILAFEMRCRWNGPLPCYVLCVHHDTVAGKAEKKTEVLSFGQKPRKQTSQTNQRWQQQGDVPCLRYSHQEKAPET